MNSKRAELATLVSELSQQTETEAILKLLRNSEKQKKLQAIFESRFTLQEPNLLEELSFQYIAVPLCQLLAQQHLIQCNERYIMDSLYSKMLPSSSAFVERYASCTNQLLDMDEDNIVLTLNNSSGSSFFLNSLFEIVYPFVVVIETCLKKIPEFSSATFPEEVSQTIRGAYSNCVSQGLTTRNRRRFTKVMKNIASFLDEKAPNAGTEGCIDGPGSLSSVGRRHDNDYEQFRDIEIFPTQSEILCDRAPYLPKLSGVTGSAVSLGENGAVDAHLGAHFRLLREDLICSFRLAIRQFIDMSPFQRDSLVDFSFETRKNGSVEGLCYVWPDIHLRDIAASLSSGPAFIAEIPQIFPDLSLPERYYKWTEAHGAKLLQAGSLVCLLCYPSQNTSLGGDATAASSGKGVNAQPKPNSSSADSSTEPLMLFAKVLKENRESLPQNLFSCFIQLVPVSPKDISSFVKYLQVPTVASFEKHDRIFMLQLMGHFVTGTETVLRCLKGLNVHSVPWSPALFGTPGAKSESVRSDQSSEEPRISPPKYLNPSSSYDLSFLGKTPAACEALTTINIYDCDSTMSLLRRNAGSIILDFSQVEAFVRGISQELSVIQGPPGCGKTFIGVQIVKAVLRNQKMVGLLKTENPSKTKTVHISAGKDFSTTESWQNQNKSLKTSMQGPILCVCFTNHALDQFLESLIKEGAIQLNEVIRIGGRSKSKLLSERLLRNVTNPNQEDRQKLKTANSHFRNMASTKDELLESLLGRSHGSEFAEWMESNNGKLFLEIKRESKFDEDINRYFEIAVESWVDSARDEKQHKLRSCRIQQTRTEFLEYAKKKLVAIYQELEDLHQRVGDAKLSAKIRALRAARVVGCTTSGAAFHHKLLSLLGASIIVGEEAAEACEGHLLSTLSQRTEQLILIGDHQQLRPRIAQYELTKDSKLGYDLDISLFERIARDCVVPIAKLSTQRRMHPLIGDLARLTLYPFLKDSEVVRNYEDSPVGFQNPIFFWDHSEPEGDKNDAVGRNRSYYNEHEVDLLVALARYVIKQGYDERQIAVITPYIGQLKLIRARIAEENISVAVDEKDLEELILANLVDEMDIDKIVDVTAGAEENQNEAEKRDSSYEARTMDECLRLSTVDNFQGEEADIVLISTVRCNNEGKLGFLASSNRSNVMLTRARKGMYIIGSASTILSSPESTHLHQIVSYLQKQGAVSTALPLKCKNHNTISKVSAPSDFSQDGGCNIICNALLPCGHYCHRQCHPDNTAHNLQTCQARCDKVFPVCKHQCQNKCGEDCGNCEEPTLVRLGCEHKLLTTCSQALAPNNLKCEVIVQESFISKCGHTVQLQCWEGGVHRRRCTMECDSPRECGHLCKETCHANLTTFQNTNMHRGRCGSTCGQQLPCGHPCQERCHIGRNCPHCCLRCTFECPHGKCARLCAEPCVPCHEKCDWECSCGRGWRCEEPCVTPCMRLPCDEKCSKLLDCGHQCPSICGEECPPVQYCFVCSSRTGREELEKDLCTSENEVGEDLSMKNVENNFPVIVLKCGHVATISWLDEYFEMDRFYQRTEGKGWSGLKPVKEIFSDKRCSPKWHLTPECVECDRPIIGIRRYHRVTKLWHLYHQALQWVSLLVGEFQREDRIQVELSETLTMAIKVKERKEALHPTHEQRISNLVNMVRDGLVRMKRMNNALYEHSFNVPEAENMSHFTGDRMVQLQLHLSALEVGALILEAQVDCLNLLPETQTSDDVDTIQQQNARKFQNIEETFRKAVTLRNAMDEKPEKKRKEFRSQFRKGVEQLKANLGVFCTSMASSQSKIAGRKIQLDCDAELTRISLSISQLKEQAS